jgi:insertion element IS1 protein InsB
MVPFFLCLSILKSNKKMLQDISCYKVSDLGFCPNCKSRTIIKNGFTKNKKQQYHCKNCNKRSIDFYTYQAYIPDTNQKIVLLTKEGLGIRSTARVLKIATSTLLKRIVAIAACIEKPIIGLCKSYEVDEMRTYIKRKTRLIWIVYALERTSKKVVSFWIGRRTNATLNVVVKTLQLAKAKKIYTDGLHNYKSLIAPKVHVVQQFATNHIERKNLSLRTHLKRLNRRTICFSRSKVVLMAVLKIYFWL